MSFISGTSSSGGGATIKDRSPKGKQKFLRNLGYDLAVDGNWGRFSKSAWQAWQKGMSAERWNRFIDKHFKNPKPKGQGGTGPGPGGFNPLDGVAPSMAPAAPGGVPQLPSLAQLGISIPKNILGASIDPAKYAKGVVEAEYGPQIAELARARQKAEAQGKQNQLDIGSWYQQLLGQADQAAQANLGTLNNLLSGHDAATKGAVDALGGGAAAADAAAWGGISRANLAGLGAAEGNFQNNLRPIFALQGAEARTRQLREDTSLQSDLAAKMAGLQGAKGAAYSKALYEGIDQAQRQRIAGINAQAQLSMLPVEYAKAMAGLQATQGNPQQEALQYDLDRLRLALGMQELQQNEAQGSSAVPTWGQLNPSQLQGLRSELLSTVVSKDNPSQLAVNPMRVYNAWGATLRGLSGGQWNPFNNQAVKQWRNDLLRTFLPAWNRSHPKKKYAFRNGKLVYIGSGK